MSMCRSRSMPYYSMTDQIHKYSYWWSTPEIKIKSAKSLKQIPPPLQLLAMAVAPAFPSTFLRSFPPPTDFLALKFKPELKEMNLVLPIYKFMLEIVTPLVLVVSVPLTLNASLAGDFSGTTIPQDPVKPVPSTSTLKEDYAYLAHLPALDAQRKKE